MIRCRILGHSTFIAHLNFGHGHEVCCRHCPGRWIRRQGRLYPIREDLP
jgi:hypothetical protein